MKASAVLNGNSNKLKGKWWDITNRLYLFLLIGIFLIFSNASSRAEEDHWKALGVIRLPDVSLPAFTLRNLDGESITLTDLKGNVVLLNFWTTWCPPCKIEMPSMERLYRKLKDKGFTIIAVDIMEKPETVKRFARKYQLSFPILLDTTGEVSAKYMANAIPTSYIVNKDGKAVGKALGPREWDNEHAVAILNELLGG